ncbi:hypothetical protein Leryth_002555 [Lithospermum erythrorhizon]|nr:hypothetical protein Leryth_002555 [Lithospermum erythrorhizon]
MDNKNGGGVNKQATNEKDAKLEGLPVETSPYTQYNDLEDYKKQGYGTEGHLEPKQGRGAGGSTDAPTLTGDSATAKDLLPATDTINKQGVN